MIAPGLRVPRREGEAVRRDLAESGLLRNDLEIRQEGDYLILPLAGTPSEIPASWGTVVDREFTGVARKGPARYRDLLEWPEPEKDLLPRSFDVVGDIVLVRLPRELESRKDSVGEALLRFVPGARLVGLDHGVHGADRKRTVERIAGAGPWRTRHRENGVDLEVDVENAYFSPRLAREHDRVAEEIRPHDRVYDLCCGVGPFSVTIAHREPTAVVTAVDANPEAIALLRATLARYPFGGRVTPLVARLEEFLPSAKSVERSVMNLPHEGIKYLPSVARTTAPGGRLYYYEVVARSELATRGTALVNLLSPTGVFEVAAERVVHPYSPSSDLVAFVLERSG
ncbi:MAG TPA: methyltransferase domain-containing protein [Thermoplasmata archaeon]|nr:methyltransferase domain-containing protein [Thermoplasmata archaeon]